MNNNWIKNAQRYCKQLNDDGTCIWKQEGRKQCDLDICCNGCDKSEDYTCPSTVGICTWLY
jgi:hypothetical protein